VGTYYPLQKRVEIRGDGVEMSGLRVLAAALLLTTASAIPTHHQNRASAFERDVGPVDPSVPAAVATGCKAHVNQTDCSADSCCNWWVRAQPDGAVLARVQKILWRGGAAVNVPLRLALPPPAVVRPPPQTLKSEAEVMRWPQSSWTT